MDREIKNFIDNLFDFDVMTTYHFKELYGLTFVFRKDITQLNDQMTSAEISPVGIIYRENDEFYIAPLDRAIEVDEIIKEYVENILI